MGVSCQLLLTLIALLIFITVGETCSIAKIRLYCKLYISLQLRPNSLDASLILAVLLLLWGDLLPVLRTVVSIIMQDCITIMVVNASSA